MLGEWRKDGYGWNLLETWAVGFPGTAAQIPMFAAGAEGACFEDSADPAASAYSAYGAMKDDMFLIDKQGVIRHRISIGMNPLSDAPNRAQVDAWVRALLR